MKQTSVLDAVELWTKFDAGGRGMDPKNRRGGTDEITQIKLWPFHRIKLQATQMQVKSCDYFLLYGNRKPRYLSCAC